MKPYLAALIVSAAFGLLHSINIYSYASLQYAMTQIFFAFGLGMFLAVCYLRWGIGLCIAVHFVINLLGSFTEHADSAGLLVLTNGETAFYLLIAVASLVYSWKKLIEA